MNVNLPDFRFSREVRIGTVLYGGVSLAVYINGVAQEMYRAVRGEGIYGLLKVLTDSDVVVDVVSGTSAGGLNGLYFGYALTAPRTANFLRFSNLWREQGDIAKLLHSPSPKPIQRDSLLDGEGYYQSRLAEAFADLDANPAPESPFASTITELDCFITGTDVGGNVYTKFDDQGQPITVKEHRSVFQLKYRRGRMSDFQSGPENHQAMAKLARITSCFPVAFPPVKVQTKAAPGTPDSLLARWGHLGTKTESQQRVYLDGGVLDNKPFSHTLDAIFRRTANRQVKRILYYVEPVPEVFDPNTVTPPPDVVEAALGATLELPRYESISGDLERVLERNRRLDQIERVIRCTKLPRVAGLDAGPPVVSGMQLRVYEHTRAMHLVTRILEGALRSDGRSRLIDDDDLRRCVRKLTENFFDMWSGQDVASSNLLLSQLKPCDPYFRLRGLFHITYTLIERPLLEWNGAAYVPTLNGITLARVNRLISLHEILRYQLENLVDRIEVNWEDEFRSEALIWTVIQNSFHELLPDSEDLKALLAPEPDWLNGDQLTRFRKALEERARKIVEKSKTQAGLLDLERAPNLLFFSLMDWIDRELTRPVMQADPAAWEAWDEFHYQDVLRFPLQYSAGFEELDRLRVVRISPKDAQTGFSKRGVEKKLAGSQFSNFGGFFKKSWRSNDVLWGRMDGVCKLAEELMDRGRVEQLLVRGDFPQILSSRLEEYGSSIIASFKADPQSEQEVGQVIDWIWELASGDQQRREAALARWDQIRSLLVCAEQRLIIRELWPVVVEDSIGEMIEWNRLTTKPKKPEEPPAFEVQRMRFDRQITVHAAAELARQGLQDILERNQIDRLFERYYNVGEERIPQTIPPSVLAETGSRALLVLRDCLFAAMGEERAQRIRGTGMFQFGIDLPLRWLYNFSRFGRYAPESLRVAVNTLTAVALTIIAATGFVGFMERDWRAWMWMPLLAGFGLLLFSGLSRRLLLRKYAPR